HGVGNFWVMGNARANTLWGHGGGNFLHQVKHYPCRAPTRGGIYSVVRDRTHLQDAPTKHGVDKFSISCLYQRNVGARRRKCLTSGKKLPLPCPFPDAIALGLTNFLFCVNAKT
ncbi:MAG TPA: hypothetical protein DCZ55_22415, partial [Cyanobacteria bacterium UBA11371]|nr:hypothetical protein [Cyanobacteria bacterium UBA11371]